MPLDGGWPTCVSDIQCPNPPTPTDTGMYYIYLPNKVYHFNNGT